MPPRKRQNRRNGDASSSSSRKSDVTGDGISGSVTSSIRVTLLVLIGLAIVAFLFYPDISRIIGALSKPEQNENSRSQQQTVNSEKEPLKRVERHVQNDLMESEEDDVIDKYTDDVVDEQEDSVTDIPEPEVDEIQDNDSKVNDKTEAKSEPTSKTKMADDTGDASPMSKTKQEGNMLKFTSDDTGAKFVDLKMEDLTKEEPKIGKPKKSKTKTKKTVVQEKNEPNPELPKEVREFKPRILNTVTAKKIFADGRRIPPIELLAQKPTNSTVKVFLFNEFLSTEECDGLMRAHDSHVRESTKQGPILCFDSINTLRLHLKEAKKKVKVTPNVFTEGTKCVNATFSRQLSDWFKGNWSYSTAFYPGESRFSSIFANRVKSAMGLDQENGGKFQITSYPTGKAYKSHTDCIVEGMDKRDRVATVLIYLQDVEKGGETKFPDLGIWVKPRKGRALVWNNMSPDGDCEADSIHTASKVEKGNKYVLIRWYYYKSFYSLGKRPPEPPLPNRQAGQPRVSCDEYEYGSCRWYDEWSYEHLLDYEQQKFTLI